MRRYIMDTDWNNIKRFEDHYSEWVKNYNIEHEIQIIPKNIIYDGFVGDRKDFENGHRILYVLEEARDEDSVGGETAFWVRGVVNNKAPMYRGRRLLNNLWLIQKAISIYVDEGVSFLDTEKYILDTEEFKSLNINDLRSTAFINLKKIGGGKKLNATADVDGMTFNEWVNEFKEDLAKQIELISPNHIVICGKATIYAFNEYVNPMLSDKLKDVKIYYSYHPSCTYGYRRFLRNISKIK